MSKLILVAPLAGWSAPLEEVPDTVFAGRMLGDGLAIDPTGGVLHAPCDGEIVTIAPTHHAITLRAAAGPEILLHVGIDTVKLAGEGFESHVAAGQRVRAGDPLLHFDLDLLARRAPSLLTPVIVLEGGGFRVAHRKQDCQISVGDLLMELESEQVTVAPVGAPGGSASAARRIKVALEHGIHARPAALLAAGLKGLAAEVTVLAHGREANARSTVALMTLGARKGDEVEVRAVGTDSAAALDAMQRALEGALHAEQTSLVVRAAAPGIEVHSSPTALPERSALGPTGILHGVVASRGLAVGRTFQLRRSEIEVRQEGAGVSHENAELDRARTLVKTRLQTSAESSPQAAREIIAAHLELLDDPGLVTAARASIGHGKSAGYAWREVIRAAADALRALDDERMAERVDDLLDLESQVLAALHGEGATATLRELPANTVLIARELLPSQFVALDPARLAGICMAGGGATSHVSILAAALGIPVLVAMGTAVLALPDTTAVVLDAENGLLRVSPEREQLQTATQELEKRHARRSAEQAAAQQECRTADGERIEVFANLGSAAEAELAVRNGAEGCGLLRTEFLFLERRLPPSETEQAEQYQRIATALAGRRLFVRTLDIGGDKPIPYLPLPREDNPALGLRGVRTSFWRPELLRTQLRAVLSIRPEGQARVLLPMITDPAEIQTVRVILEEERQALGRAATIDVGVMIETPAAAIMADRIAAVADFLSIGTNDLTQYVLAMDRGHPELAARLDALHPAVLRLIAQVAEAGQAHGRTVAVCGGLASEPAAAPLLIGLGVRELSAVAGAIPSLKALIRTVTQTGCRELARRALGLESAAAVRQLLGAGQESPAAEQVAFTRGHA